MRLGIAALALLAQLTRAWVYAEEISVDSPAAAKAALQRAKPGDVVSLAVGPYENGGTWIGRSGTPEAPIVFQAAIPGHVRFTGEGKITLKARNVVIDGFVFDQVWKSNAVVTFESAENCRLTNCAFIECGNPKSTKGRIINMTDGSRYNRVDHCYMQGNLSMGMGIVCGPEVIEQNSNNQFDHNYFKDIIRRSNNGQEAVQLGQGGAPEGSEAATVVEYNLFENASGDAEIISNKSHHNIMRHNTFRGCQAELTLRGGFFATVEGNWFFGNKGGIRVFGAGHVIVNNYIEGSQEDGIRMPTGGGGKGGKPDAHYREAKDCLVAHNTIVNCAQTGLAIGELNRHFSIAVHRKPANNRFCNNLLVSNQGLLVQNDGENSTWTGNLVWASGAAEIGSLTEGARVANPLLEPAADGFHRLNPDSPAIDAGVVIPTSPPPESLQRDIEGQPRTGIPDVGCDELARGATISGPLQPADVGPEWMKGDPACVRRIPSPRPIPALKGA